MPLRARRTARGSIQRRVRAKTAGTSISAVTITATTVIAVAKPNAAKVARPDRRSPSSETSTVVPASTTERPAVRLAAAAASTTPKPARRYSSARVSISSA